MISTPPTCLLPTVWSLLASVSPFVEVGHKISESCVEDKILRLCILEPQPGDLTQEDLEEDWHLYTTVPKVGFPGNSAGKESACNAEDPGLIPGSGRPPGEGIGYPLQYSWASLMAWMVKNPPAMWEIRVQSLDWEVPLEKGTATHSSILACTITWT